MPSGFVNRFFLEVMSDSVGANYRGERVPKALLFSGWNSPGGSDSPHHSTSGLFHRVTRVACWKTTALLARGLKFLLIPFHGKQPVRAKGAHLLNRFFGCYVELRKQNPFNLATKLL